ncbi:MAG: hypothetical protein P9F75_07400 [Candidatus Contendobacter sp.]|nr:hypothetical protein [Candidatus Contendobacter sp.]
MPCRRSNYKAGHKAGLTLVMLGVVLALCALLMGCASPCKPALALARLPSRTAGASLDGMIDSVGIRCEFRFER